MIGATCLPMPGCFMRCVRIRTNAMVLETSRSPEPASSSFRYSSGGASSFLAAGLRAGRFPGSVHCRFIGVVDLHRVMPAAPQFENIFVAQVRDQLEYFRVLAEEVLANVSAVLRDVGLHFPVDHFTHALLQKAGFVAGQ